MVKLLKLNYAASLYLCVLGGLLLFPHPTPAQYRVEKWSTEQGLPHRTVRSVLQTRDGYVWAATSDGLARFDGVRFTVFNTANSAGLTTNRLELLAETEDGSLWITGEEEGLFRLRGGNFSTVSTENGLPSNKIFSLYADRESNRLLILTQKGSAVWQDEKLAADNLSELRQEYLSLIDNTGAFCIKENGAVRRFTAGGIVEYKLPEDSPTVILTRVHQDRDGAIWIGTFDWKEPVATKLYIFKNGETSAFSRSDGLPDAFIEQILEDRRGNIWVAVGKFGKGGLLKFENGKFRVFGKEDGFESIGVLGLTEDHEGGIWAATTDHGLTRLSEQFIKSLTSEKNGLTTDNIYPLYEDREGEIWVGAWRFGSEKKGGVDKFENGRFTNFATKGQITSLLPTALFKDREGNLWIGAFDGVTRFRDGTFTQYTERNGFPHSEVSAITQTSDGALWFGTAHGLTKLRNDKFTEFTTDDGLPHSDVRCLFESRDGTLWIATRVGLGSYKNGEFTNYSISEIETRGQGDAGTQGENQNDSRSNQFPRVPASPRLRVASFPAVQVRSIYEDADGTLWLGTYDAGLFRYKNGEFKAISLKDGLFDQGAFQVLEDDSGRFWMSSNRGVYRVSRQELNDFAEGKIQKITSVGYGVKDGMADAECNGGRSPAGFKSRKDGTLWFPTQKGVVVINPRALSVDTQPPHVAVENCLLDRQEVACGDINILPENDSLEIRYTGLSFNKPEQIKFKYKLEGLDENWVEAGLQRTAYFTHLPPGEYAFRVSAANVDGVWNEAGTGLKIRVKPPFYRTWWFGFLSFLAFIGILYRAYKRRTDYLYQRAVAQEEFSRQLLESQEQERQRIAVELHDSLGQDLLIIKNWAMLGLNQNGNPEKTKRQLGEISETASQAIEEVREIAYNLRPYHLDELGLSKAIESMCERVSQSSGIDLECSIDDLDAFFPKDQEINFYRIAQECLNNIVKHSGATKAKVLIHRDAQNLRLTIEDNGKGFDVNQTKTNLQDGKQRSLGLVGLVERGRILGGKPVLESIPNQGTKFILHLPRKNDK